MNRQEIFDKVKKHLLTQGKRAVNAMGKCKYRIFDENGEVIAKCAIGALIPDEIYVPSMEGTTFHWINLYYRDKILDYLGLSSTDDDVKFLNALQAVHDHAVDDFFIEDVIDNLKLFADRYNLNYGD